eukprot:5207629-Alexandrium_andersonii.AAC.1
MDSSLSESVSITGTRAPNSPKWSPNPIASGANNGSSENTTSPRLVSETSGSGRPASWKVAASAVGAMFGVGTARRSASDCTRVSARTMHE